MWNKLGYVALTYYSPKRLLFAVVFGLGYIGMAIGFRSLSSLSSSALPPFEMRLWFLGWFSFMFGVFLVTQAKWQFANPRARLIPGFRTPHLLLLAILLFVVVALIPWLVVLGTEVNHWGALAFSAALAAPMVWASHTNQGFPWSFISLGIFFSSFTSAASTFWLALDATPLGIHVAIFVVAWAGLIYCLYRIATLREDEPGYEFYAVSTYDRRSRGERAEQRRMLARMLSRQPIASRVADWWHDQLAKRANPSSGASYALFRYGFRPTPLYLSLFSLFILALIAIYFVANWYGMFSDAQQSIAWGALLMPFWMVISIPVMIASESLAARRPRMASEILWPVARTNFYRSLLLSGLQDSFILWGIFNVIFTGAAWYLSLPLFAPEVVFSYLCLGASLNLLGAALGMQLALRESRITRILGLTIVAGGMIIVLVAWSSTREWLGDGPFIVASFVIAALGWFALRSARRAWCNAELG